MKWGMEVAKNEAKAEEEFKKAVSQSITLYYYYDSVSTGENARRYNAPTAEETASFAAAKWNSTEYADKLDATITQKWLHFGFLASREAWSDIRRTGYPSGLAFPEVPVPSQMCRTAGDTRIRKSTTIPTIKRCQPKTLTTTNCSGKIRTLFANPFCPKSISYSPQNNTD